MLILVGPVPFAQNGNSKSEDLDLGINWDTTSNHQTRFMKWVFEQKRHMKVERNRLDIYWKRLQEERKKFEDVSKMKERDLQVREAKLAEVKDLISTAAELKEIGL